MIQLYTATTPNCWKVSICLEEMAIPYRFRALDLAALEQKEDWYTAICPNGRVPAIVDEDNGDFIVFESGAILLYLAELSGMLLPQDAMARSVAIQWLMFQMGGVGPMQGQLLVFERNAPERISFAIDRYRSETKRLYGVLDRRLADVEFLAGDFSVADIANWTWVSLARWSGIELAEFANLKRWADVIAERPAVQRGRHVPEKFDADELMENDEEVAAVEARGRRIMQS